MAGIEDEGESLTDEGHGSCDKEEGEDSKGKRIKIY